MNNEIVLITGASNGIGRGLAKAYAAQGATVVTCDKDQKNGKSLVNEIREVGGQCYFYQCDVTHQKEITNLFSNMKKEVGLLTILINNSGISSFKNMFELELNEWDEIINTNLRSVFLFSKEASKVWKKHSIRGRIINMASTRAAMSEPDSEGYAASKGGIVALTHAMALSLSDFHIRVNAISPGWIHTGDPEELRNIDHRQHPSNRVGRIEDVVKSAFYLSDPDNHFINGQNLTIDGGMTKKMIYEH